MQALLPFEKRHIPDVVSYRDRLIAALRDDLDFHDQDSRYASHNFHSFPAKFPPQLPRKFIGCLTQPGDIVLDPMVGSGTTVVEASLAQRQGVGLDIDPLAILITRVKTTPLDPEQAIAIGNEVIENAKQSLREQRASLEQDIERRWDDETRAFIDFWFRRQTQIELLALLHSIARVDDTAVRRFLELAFSAIIITKSGGVSLALDLGHTRPHRAKYVVTLQTAPVADGDGVAWSGDRLEHMTKTLRSPIDEFRRRVHNNARGLYETGRLPVMPSVGFADAEKMPLRDGTVDLIVTSPPYASNAIDYMRAHKFTLVWLGHAIERLSEHRKKYIGSEAVGVHALDALPARTTSIVESISALDARKGRVVALYYSQMKRVLAQMYRVLRPGRAAIVVVGSSVMRGRDTETHECLADIGRSLGFDVPAIGVRKLDRDRRMLPAAKLASAVSQIEQRMHDEYVIGFLKPPL